jgi:hypothetical protein
VLLFVPTGGRRRKKNSATAAEIARITPSVTPTPIPIAAPVDKPLLWAVPGLLLLGIPLSPVGDAP